MILEFPAFVLIGTYSPANRDETRDDFRLGYMEALDIRVRNLVAIGKRVIVTGDLNVVRDVSDTANLSERLKKEGMTAADFFSVPSRRVFNQLLFEGNVIGRRDQDRDHPVLWDLGRLFHPTREGMFTCWDTKKNTRPGNFGSRIDYVLCSDNMKSWFVDSNIQEGLMGSDHCPVFAVISDTVKIGQEEVFIKDIMNPPGVFRDGNRLRDWSTKDLLPLSAKLIPEFDRRRNIKDMFFKKSVTPKIAPAPSQGSSSSQVGESEITAASGSPTVALERAHPALPPATPPSTLNSSSGGLKRPTSVSASPNKPQKKARAGLNREPSMKGQSSLTGFFKPKASNNGTKKPNETIVPLPGGIDGTTEVETGSTPTELEILKADIDESEGDSAFASAESVFDPIQAKESWSKLLGKRIVPKCEHGEDCISLVTKKSGMNRGKYLASTRHTFPQNFLLSLSKYSTYQRNVPSSLYQFL